MNEQDLFIQAMSRQDPEERQQFLDEVCRERPDLRRRMDCLLEHSERAEDYLEQPPVGLLESTSQTELIIEGTSIGPYTLVEQIGEGGMGVVYVAKQTEPVKRKVALKLIKPGMDSRQVIARF